MENQNQYALCHTGNKQAFEDIGPNYKVVYYGGGSRNNDPTAGFNALIDLSRQNQQKLKSPINVVRDTGCGPKFKPPTRDIPELIIDIDWPDGTAGNLQRADYAYMVHAFREMATKQFAKTLRVLVSCFGGHGRTGTFLACMFGLTHPKAGCPVTNIRKVYCKEAVETVSQLDHVNVITGIEVVVEPTSRSNMRKRGRNSALGLTTTTKEEQAHGKLD